jgi:hypothetical protein
VYVGEVKKAKFNFDKFIKIKVTNPELKAMAEEELKKCDLT